MNRFVTTVATVVIIIAIVAIVTIFTDFKLPGKKELPKFEGPQEKLTIWFVKHPFTAPIAVAYVKGYFIDEGLDATLTPYLPHSSDLNVMLNSQTALASSAEPVVVKALINGKPLKVAAVISTSEMAFSVVALKKKGISVREDLKGKRIGVTPGTSGEFNLHMLLTLSRIPLTEVSLINLEPADMEKAITSDIVDAVSSWEPHTTKILEKFGSGAVQFYNTPPVTGSHCIVVSQKLIEENPLIIEKALRALIRAENFIRENPAQACAIAAGFTGTERPVLCRIWGHYNHEIKLDQNLIVRFEVLARWMTEKAGSEKDSLPNFFNHIYSKGLLGADPDKVTVVHRGSL
jgi:ABC-type nitrate/sulfonate/bicarbonate transport system substrate-binding protein